jgi:hypothetical protein
VNPLFQYARLGSARGLLAPHPHLPLARELLSPLVDPNMSIRTSASSCTRRS